MTTHLVPEWEEQDALILAWPHAETDWVHNLNQIEQVYLDLIEQTTRFQHVLLLAPSDDLKNKITSQLLSRKIDLDKVIFIITKYNDTWLRDTGPITVKTDTEINLLDFRFNGWGGKYNAQLDDQVCQHLFDSAIFKNSKKLTLPNILEGGSIETNGNGVLLTTQQCLLSKTRNPELAVTDYEHMFNKLFGTDTILWIENSNLIGDDTDGHIDMLARFCSETVIAYTTCDDVNDPQYHSLHQMRIELEQFRTKEGELYTLKALPIPKAIYNDEGNRLPASYANFCIINGAVLVPTYNDKNDSIAIDQLQQCFPDREIIGINALPVIEQSGSLHCLCMQLPKGVM